MNRSLKVLLPVLLLKIFFPLLLLAVEETTDERLAAQYFRNGQYEEAAVLYEDLFEKAPTEIIYNNYLKCLIELEDYRRAERVIETQIENNPEQVRYKVDLGYVMLEAGNTRRGNRHLNRLIDDLPDIPRKVNNLANAFLRHDMTELALETYEAGRDMLGNSHPFNIQIAQIYEKTGEYEKMMVEYVDLLAEDEEKIKKIRGILQDALEEDPEFKKNDALRKVLLKRSQKRASKTLYSEMLLWLSIQQKDFSMALRQAKVLGRRTQAGGETVKEVADLSLINRNFDVAEEAYNYIIDMGASGSYYLEANVGLLDVKFQRLIESYDYSMNELKMVEKAYEEALEEFGIHAQSLPIIRNLANLKAFYLNKPNEAIELLESIIDMPRVSRRVKAECRVEMADILVLNGEVWDAKLIYSRVDKTFGDDPVGHEAKFKNAQLSFYMGQFDWAKAQLDILKAATHKLIANDAMALSMKIQDNIGFDDNTEPLEMYGRAEQMIFMNRFDDAAMILDSIQEKFPEHQINDDVIFAKAQINLKTGNYHDADSLLAVIVDNYSQGILADEALFMRAEINDNIINKSDVAKKLYRKITTDYPASIYSHTARNRFRNLRGDLIN